jgi:hypothetical protein
MVERNGGRTTGVVIEMPPGPREVRWVSDATRDAEGLGRTERRHLSFPWVVLVLVFVDGELSNLQQAFFRTAPIGSLADPLCYTNLLNVARGYDQESWVCLVNIERSLARLTWEQRVQVVTRHFWEAAYTRSSEINEGNSYWSCTRGLDPRLASAEAWERATREHPYFALDIPWHPTGHTLGSTLTRMLDVVSPWRPIEGADQLATLIQQEGP